jgi:hypothetical protein
VSCFEIVGLADHWPSRTSSEQARIAAADKLLDRAHGKPKAESEMPVTLDDDYGAS